MRKIHRRLTITRALLVFVLATCTGGAAGYGSGPAAAADCPTYNPPNALTLTGGTPQSAQLGMPFSDPLQVTLANTNDCPTTTPLAGIAVTFAAPGSGPSGTFSSSGSNQALVGTNASGAAAAPQFTANRLAGGYQLVASSAYGSVSFSLVNTASGVAATITPGESASQSAVVGSRYAQPLQATVLDVNGSPIGGATVTFTLGGAGGAGAGAGASGPGANFDGAGAQVIELTNASGIATSPLFTANLTAGKFTATAATDGTNAPASYSLDNLASKPPTINAVAAATRSALVGAAYAKPLQVKLRDGNGQPLQGASVTFTLGSVGSGAGTASAAGASFTGGAAQATETTNAAGIATSPRLTANNTAGTFVATVTTTGANTAARFVLHNRAARPAAVSVGTAATESTTVGTRFPIRLAVTVTDKYGNPVAGVTVSFSAPTQGAGGRFDGKARTTRTRTDAKGIAVAPSFVANHTAGGYVVRARAAGHTAAFALVNQPSL